MLARALGKRQRPPVFGWLAVSGGIQWDICRHRLCAPPGKARLGIRSKKVRFAAMTAAGGVAGFVSVLLAPRAFAPPAVGIPNVNVTRNCVGYGQHIRVSGFGFAPTSRVVLSFPFGH